MSKVAGFIIGGIEIAAGIVLLATPGGQVLGTELIIQGTMMIVSQAIVDLTAAKTPARAASEMSIQLGEQPRSVLFGEGFTAGSLVDGFDYGGKYGTDWEVLVIRLADHKCESLTGFFVNADWNPYVGDGFYPRYDDQLQVFFRADTTTVGLPSIVTTNGPGWSSGDQGVSGCDVIVAYKADKPNDKHPGWPGGRPHFGFVVKGKQCYDPRLDSSVGGSGTHRWTDPSTWQWTENAAVCRYNWVRGIYANDAVTDPTALLVGRGLTDVEAPPANVFAPANLCDETINGAPRYRCDGPVYANQAFIDVETMFAQATAGTTVTREGSVELEPGQAKSVVAAFTDDDLLVGSKVSWNDGILSESNGDWVNSVVVRYVEPAQQWNDFAAPVVRDPHDIFADGKPKEAPLSLRLVRYQDQALRVAEITRRLGRLWGRATVTLGPRFCELEDGDWVQWTSARRFAGATRTFRVEAYSIDEKWQNTLTLREIDASVFGTGYFQADHSVATNTSPPPAIGSPTGGQWALAAVMLTSAGASVPALEITGSASDDASVEAIVFEYWKSDGVINPLVTPDTPPWVMEGSHPPDTTKVDITSVQSGAAYYAAVTYVVSGVPGDRRVLGPVTVGQLTAATTTSSLQASEAIAQGDFVNVYNASGATRVRRADASDPTKFANGYATAAIASGASGPVAFSGANPVTVSSAAAVVYLSDATPGGFTTTAPSTAGHVVQALGPGVPSVGVPFVPGPPITL